MSCHMLHPVDRLPDSVMTVSVVLINPFLLAVDTGVCPRGKLQKKITIKHNQTSIVCDSNLLLSDSSQIAIQAHYI